MIIIFIYTVIGYSFLNSDWFHAAIDGGENMCTDLFFCYLRTIDFGLRNGGGIAESLRI